jgi:four helix bundle protein
VTADGAQYRTGNRAHGFRELLVWQKAMELVGLVYRLTSDWPKEERFGLTSQTRRAAVSIPSNIAEGQGRIGPGEFARFVSIAHGSLCELETQLLLAAELGFTSEALVNQAIQRISEIGRMTRALHDSLGRSRPSNSKVSEVSEGDFYDHE